VVDFSDYGSVTVTKPIAIDGNGAYIEASGFTGVYITASGTVEIRNLTIHVEPASNPCCDGIVSYGSDLRIKNVSIHGPALHGVYANGGSVIMQGVDVTGGIYYGVYLQDIPATIVDSVVRNSGLGIGVVGQTSVTQALIEHSRMISNSTGLQVINNGAAATARISDSVITGNFTGVSTSMGGQIITFRNNTWAGNTADGSTPFSISLK
jgi:hypothetical protein